MNCNKIKLLNNCNKKFFCFVMVEMENMFLKHPKTLIISVKD